LQTTIAISGKANVEAKFLGFTAASPAAQLFKNTTQQSYPSGCH
jgi:hypothetical protein